MADEHREEFVYVGSFSPREIKRVTHYLEGEEVEYEVEFDDSEIRTMSPLDAKYGLLGASGPSVKVHLYIDPRKQLEYDAIIETLYPP